MSDKKSKLNIGFVCEQPKIMLKKKYAKQLMKSLAGIGKQAAVNMKESRKVATSYSMIIEIEKDKILLEVEIVRPAITVFNIMVTSIDFLSQEQYQQKKKEFEDLVKNGAFQLKG